MTGTRPHYLMLISVHGLIRADDLELGRDADTGGQTKYVIELARHLVEHSRVERVDLVTKRIVDEKVSSDYAAATEPLAPGAQIVRIACGPDRYLPKEALWPHLEGFVDNLVQYVRRQGRAPDLIHGHYADAGYVAANLSAWLNVPMAFTGHSLGRIKRQRLRAGGINVEQSERRYKLTERIEAEETALDHAAFVVASTHQEIQEQYELYDNYEPQRMNVIPPGVDLSRFTPPPRHWSTRPAAHRAIFRFLADPGKPMILALSRPDPRKNVTALVHAFGRDRELQEMANLVLVLGTRQRIADLDESSREVMSEVLFLIDAYDLHGRVAYPKQHSQDEIPAIYQLATRTRGVFVNPALTEPFGLTLLEAAASGLPVIATQDGGPRDILDHCRNGMLIDPLDIDALADALKRALGDRIQWKRWSQSGLRGSHRHFSWTAHVNSYVKAVRPAIHQTGVPRGQRRVKSRLITADRIVVCDIDNTLIGDRAGLRQLLQRLRKASDQVAFGIATGRSMALTQEVLAQWQIPTPQLLITSVGSEIHYGPQLVCDTGWARSLAYRWRPDAIREAMADLPGLTLQGPEGQSKYKISYLADAETMPPVEDIQAHLRRARLAVKPIFSHGAYLDLLPIRASKGKALRYFADRWNLPLERCLVAGDSGNDEDMLTGNTLGVVVGNHDPELDRLRSHPRIYFAEGSFAWGILEGIERYDFLGSIRNETEELPAHD